MKKLEKLTKKQEQLMTIVRDQWIQMALLAGDDVDEEKAREGINWLYEITKLEKPHIVFVDSPMGTQLAVNMVIEMCKGNERAKDSVENSVWNSVWNSVGDSVENSVWNSVGDSVENSVRNSAWNSVRDSVRNSVRDSVRNSVWNSVGDSVENSVRNSAWNSVRDSVRNSVRDSVRNSVWNSVRDSVRNSVENSVRNSVWNSVEDSVGNSEKLTYHWFCYESLGWASGWVSFYDYFRKIGIVKMLEFDKYVEYLQSGVFMSVFQDGLAVVCRRPNNIQRDEQQRLHCESGPAIEWRDGFKLYYLYGREFKEDLYRKITTKQIDFKEVMAIANMEQRMAALKFLGTEYLLENTKAEKLDESKKGNELYLVKGIYSQDAYFLKYTCPSTGRVYVKGVPPEVGNQKDADSAQAWSHNMTLKEYLNIKAES